MLCCRFQAQKTTQKFVVVAPMESLLLGRPLRTCVQHKSTGEIFVQYCMERPILLVHWSADPSYVHNTHSFLSQIHIRAEEEGALAKKQQRVFFSSTITGTNGEEDRQNCLAITCICSCYWPEIVCLSKSSCNREATELFSERNTPGNLLITARGS